MNLRKKAEALPKALRRKIIMDYQETDWHTFLKELFQAMQPDYTVEITHGPQEFGKDLVILKVDNFTKEVIGVVVKRGRINGKTLGDVDDLKSRTEIVLSKGAEKTLREIKSQIEQALAHPTETKSILEDLPVSKVFVVLAVILVKMREED
ncbi:MAG: restriction endonuclease [Candidatus Poribacteria bacterium]|nr:restriction endonuclease [Candidatus Poribacteria bacterium]